MKTLIEMTKFNHPFLYNQIKTKISRSCYHIQSFKYSVLNAPYIHPNRSSVLIQRHFNITIPKRFSGSAKKAGDVIKTGMKEAIPVVTPKSTALVPYNGAKPKTLPSNTKPQGTLPSQQPMGAHSPTVVPSNKTLPSSKTDNPYTKSVVDTIKDYKMSPPSKGFADLLTDIKSKGFSSVENRQFNEHQRLAKKPESTDPKPLMITDGRQNPTDHVWAIKEARAKQKQHQLKIDSEKEKTRIEALRERAERLASGTIQPSNTNVWVLPPPPPPPLPKEGFIKPKDTNTISEPITDESLKEAKKKLQPFDKWKKYSPLTEEEAANPKTPFKSVANNQPYKSKVNKNSKVSDFTPEEMAQELVKRGLATKDNGSTASTIIGKDNIKYQVGGADYGVKITALGQAYHKEVPSKQPPATFTSEEIPAELGNNVTIGFTVNHSENKLLNTGEQKHLFVTQPIKTGHASPGYLTSKDTPNVIANTQYRAHQTQMENITNGTDTAIPSKWKVPQKFVPFDKIKIFEHEQVITPKWAHSYVENHVNLRILTALWEDLYNKPQQKYNPDGITKERALEMCQGYDYILHKKYPHPITYDQQLIKKENEQKKLSKDADNKTTHGTEKE